MTFTSLPIIFGVSTQSKHHFTIMLLAIPYILWIQEQIPRKILVLFFRNYVRISTGIAQTGAISPCVRTSVRTAVCSPLSNGLSKIDNNSTIAPFLLFGQAFASAPAIKSRSDQSLAYCSFAPKRQIPQILKGGFLFLPVGWFIRSIRVQQIRGIITHSYNSTITLQCPSCLVR